MIPYLNEYQKLINEDKFKNKKWIYITKYKDIDIYYNNNEPDYHLLTRLLERTYYLSLDEADFDTLMSFILEEFLYNSENDYLNVVKYIYKLVDDYYVKMWNVKLLESELFPAGMIQLDKDKKRFYVSTILDFYSMKKKRNSIYFELEI